MDYKRRAYILDLAVSYYEKQLRGKSRKYLMRERGVTDACIKKFRVGYAPAAKGLLRFLKRHGVKPSEATDIGLFYERGTVLKLAFRNRILFPLVRGGKVLSLIGRQIPRKDEQ